PAKGRAGRGSLGVRDLRHARKQRTREPGDPRLALHESEGTRCEGQGRTTTMHEPGKSDSSVVPAESPNETGKRTVEEGEEGRELTKGKTVWQNTNRIQCRTIVRHAPERVHGEWSRNSCHSVSLISSCYHLR